MDLEWAFLVLKRELFNSLPKCGRAMVPLAPRFLRPCTAVDRLLSVSFTKGSSGEVRGPARPARQD